MHKSEAFYSRTVRKDGGTCASGCCIESGDDLAPSQVHLGGMVWECVDGRLTGLFFIAVFDLNKDVKKNRWYNVAMFHPRRCRPPGYPNCKN
jgi:hypothetical protein